MIIYHFVLDHRVGGPHVYIENIHKNEYINTNYKIVTTLKGELTDIQLINLRRFNKILYLLEILINVLIIIFLFKKNNQSKILCVHGAANIAPIISSYILKQNIVWYLHETLENYKIIIKIGKIFLRENSKIIIVAKSIKKIYKLNNSIYIPSKIDINFWDKVNNNIKYPIFRIVSVGNINPLKGYDILFEALNILNITCEVNIIGEILDTHYKYYESIKNLSDLLFKKNIRVNFLGRKNKDCIKKILSMSDVYILSSRSEACPLSLLEAMSLKLPCIASDVGDVSEIINHKINGFIFENQNFVKLSQFISYLYNIDTTEREKIGIEARKTVTDNYSFKNNINTHMQIYNQLNIGNKNGHFRN